MRGMTMGKSGFDNGPVSRWGFTPQNRWPEDMGQMLRWLPLPYLSPNTKYVGSLFIGSATQAAAAVAFFCLSSELPCEENLSLTVNLVIKLVGIHGSNFILEGNFGPSVAPCLWRMDHRKQVQMILLWLAEKPSGVVMTVPDITLFCRDWTSVIRLFYHSLLTAVSC